MLKNKIKDLVKHIFIHYQIPSDIATMKVISWYLFKKGYTSKITKKINSTVTPQKLSFPWKSMVNFSSYRIKSKPLEVASTMLFVHAQSIWWLMSWFISLSLTYHYWMSRWNLSKNSSWYTFVCFKIWQNLKNDKL